MQRAAARDELLYLRFRDLVFRRVPRPRRNGWPDSSKRAGRSCSTTVRSWGTCSENASTTSSPGSSAPPPGTSCRSSRLATKTHPGHSTSGASPTRKRNADSTNSSCPCAWTIRVCFGLPDTVSYLDLRELALDHVADILIRKLDGAKATPGTKPAKGDWVVTFGLSMEDLHAHELPADAPSDTPRLYDWLADDLIERLTQRTALETMRVTEDLRTGETLNVRLKFTWDPGRGALDFGDLAWWELLELQPYAAIYEDGENPIGRKRKPAKRRNPAPPAILDHGESLATCQFGSRSPPNALSVRISRPLRRTAQSRRCTVSRKGSRKNSRSSRTRNSSSV